MYFYYISTNHNSNHLCDWSFIPDVDAAQCSVSRTVVDVVLALPQL